MTAPALHLPPGYQPSPAARILEAGKALIDKRSGDATLKLTDQLFRGDHWFGGLGWRGPLPAPGSQGGAQVAQEIERVFVSRNLLRDVVERHRNGIAGREPLWNFIPKRALKPDEKPTAAEVAHIDEYTAALTDWWEESAVWLQIHKALDTALWSGKGHLRLFIPADALDDLEPDERGRARRGIRAGLALSDALKRIKVHATEYAQTTLTRTTDGQGTGAVHSWTDDRNQTHYEVQERTRDGAVIHPQLLTGGTDADGAPAVTYPVPDLLVYEVTLPQLVTDSIRRLNLMLDKTLTMGSRNIDLGGFTETTLLNAQMPDGEWVKDKDAPGGKRWEKARPHLRGPGTINYVQGAVMKKVDESTGKLVDAGLATPSIDHRAPTPFTVFADTGYAAREMIYDEARQLHVLITGDAAANGISRQQAVNDFMSSLEPTRIALEALLRWLLGTVLALGLHFTGRVDEGKAYRVRAQARASAVQPTPQEVEAALKLHETGAISEENFLQRIGVEDVEAERAARAREGITPAIALRIVESAPAAWIATRALQLGFPALGISDADVAAQRDLDLAPPTAPADPDDEPDPDLDPDARPDT
ncbi:hypothetical protein GO986_17970 [Deinococcus sp. HMF7620]|uniref:Phage portal protein n=1 Tax=Deinococcus arboris TaxID=2682977 RepID=A0A7C9IDW6_9DEIO|nr:hypothetical protein [Deinococcus arboris]MVN88626.1 hypothetical protein [Deinococcus arboris]